MGYKGNPVKPCSYVADVADVAEYGSGSKSKNPKKKHKYDYTWGFNVYSHAENSYISYISYMVSGTTRLSVSAKGTNMRRNRHVF